MSSTLKPLTASEKVKVKQRCSCRAGVIGDREARCFGVERLSAALSFVAVTGAITAFFPTAATMLPAALAVGDTSRV